VPRGPITSRPGRNLSVAGLGVPSVSMNMLLCDPQLML